VGTSYTSRMVSVTEVAGQTYESETTMVQTLVELTDEVATVETETTAAGQTNSTLTELPVHPEEGEEAEVEVLEEEETEVTVPAGTFPCAYVKTRSVSEVPGQGEVESISEVWHDPELPVQYKVVTTSPTSTTTIELMESIVVASDEGRHVTLRTTCERPTALPPGLPDDTFDA